jgi:predicted DsbA family dithiol-disulfide isomerase
VRDKPVDVIWMPFELRPWPAPTLRPEGSYLQTAWKNSVYPLAARMGVEIRLPDVSPQPHTRLAFEGLEFAKEHGAGDAYNRAVMRAFFQTSEDIGQPEVLTRAAVSAGLDQEAFRTALETHAYAGRVEELLRHAREEIGVTAVPLFVVGDHRLSGVQSRASLEAAIQAELARQS